MPSFKYKINYNVTEKDAYFHTECTKPRYPYIPQTAIDIDHMDDDYYVLNETTTGKIVTPKPTTVAPQDLQQVSR